MLVFNINFSRDLSIFHSKENRNKFAFYTKKLTFSSNIFKRKVKTVVDVFENKSEI